MKLTDWEQRWKDGQIGFHQDSVSHFLSKYAETVWGTESLTRVLVPLCGKSLDLDFLAERAAEVVGVEYAQKAVDEFFGERGLSPVPGLPHGELRRHDAGRHVMLVGDFFALTLDDLGAVDGVFDRASLIALDPGTRVRYAAHMGELTGPGTRDLLVTVDYDQSEMAGPPFAVSLDEVRDLFGADWGIELLETRNVEDARFRARGVSAMTESAFLMVRSD